MPAQEYPLSPLLFNTVLETQANAVAKENKTIVIRNKKNNAIVCRGQ